jgi:hypothetical protein
VPLRYIKLCFIINLIYTQLLLCFCVSAGAARWFITIRGMVRCSLLLHPIQVAVETHTHLLGQSNRYMFILCDNILTGCCEWCVLFHKKCCGVLMTWSKFNLSCLIFGLNSPLSTNCHWTELNCVSILSHHHTFSVQTRLIVQGVPFKTQPSNSHVLHTTYYI